MTNPRIWSLWDMLYPLLGEFYHILGLLEILRRSLAAGPVHPRLTELLGQTVEELEALKKYCAQCELPESIKFIDSVIPTFHEAGRTGSGAALLLKSAIQVVENESQDRWYESVPVEKFKFYRREWDAWQPALTKFGTTAVDVHSALKCYYLEENTAAVFHAMRVAEIGLRTLARERRVRIPKRPLEWATWQDILTHIDKAVQLIARRRAGPTKDAALTFYQGALGEFAAIKDTYRNVVMHVRQDYDQHQAASALLHVREFMARLSARLDELNPKAIKWGRF